jgi:type I site-specific restriction endonuclease
MSSPEELAREKIDKLITDDGWSAQIEAIRNLEKSLAANKRRALIQMATGSGKTYTAVNFVYRLIKLAGARRVLLLVDRGNLGDQTLKDWSRSDKTLSEGNARSLSACSANQYGHEHAVTDNVNVPYDVYKIDTEITAAGSRVEKGFYVDKRNLVSKATLGKDAQRS